MAAAGWVATAALLVAAWMAWALGGPDSIYFALLIAETACVTSAVAAVLQIRTYSARVCRLIRVTHGIEHPRDAEVRGLPTRER